jgi:hypothetical protein
MSRALQWVIGISVAVIALAVVLAVVMPWFFGWAGVGMMGQPGLGAGSAMMGQWFGGPGSAGGYSGMMGGRQGMMGGFGMMQPGGRWAGDPSTGVPGGGGLDARISLEQARTLAETYVATLGAGLAVVEVMEFDNNFYALVAEANLERAAFELLIDPYTGAVSPEPGPNMMWNDRYGHMGFGGGGENRLSMDEARAVAQAALDAQLPGSRVHDDGAGFYGYYTFDFDSPGGTLAGMLSVEGSTGAVWMHTWHGSFVDEWEAEEMSS